MEYISLWKPWNQCKAFWGNTLSTCKTTQKKYLKRSVLTDTKHFGKVFLSKNTQHLTLLSESQWSKSPTEMLSEEPESDSSPKSTPHTQILDRNPWRWHKKMFQAFVKIQDIREAFSRVTSRGVARVAWSQGWSV